MNRTALALLLLATVASADDSPLVALAKRSKRNISKTPVITNETLELSKGRVSYTSGENTSVQPASTPAPAKAAPAVQTAARKQTAAAPAAPAPTATDDEHTLPSSARNIDPQSTVRNVDPPSTVRNVDPSSTAVNVNPQSTARNIEPAVVNPNKQ